MTVSDRSYILNAIHYMFPGASIGEQDIESSWAGVRPLIFEEGKSASEISRKDEIWVSDSGLITIAGGKLTGYRKMAEMVTDLLATKFHLEEGRRYPTCQTRHQPISGGDVGGAANFAEYVLKHIKKGVDIGLSNVEAENLVRRYGSNIERVFNLLASNLEDAQKYHLPLDVFAQLVYAMEEESIATPIDFLKRRTGDLLFNIQRVRKWKTQVISYMADRFNWTDDAIKKHTLEVENALKACVIPVDEDMDGRNVINKN